MQDITKKIMLNLFSKQDGIAASTDNEGHIHIEQDENGQPVSENESMEMTSEGVLRITDGRIEIEYFETELTGMEGACTCVSFEEENPGLVTMLRTGAVETALVFEEGQRHICTYNTEVMAFELCVNTYHVTNTVTRDGGEIELDYSVEFRGASTEHTHVTIGVHVLEN